MRKNRSVTRRLVVALVLLVVGIALPVAAVKTFGAPWGFGDRAAVVLEKVGVAELYPGPKHPDRRTQPVTAETDLLAGDEVRVSSLVSMVRFKHRRGEAQLSTGGRMVFFDDRFELERGRMTGTVGVGPMLVDVGQVGSVEFDQGAFVVVADGQGHALVKAETGGFRVAKKGGSWLSGRAGEVAVLRRGEEPEVPAAVAKLTLNASCKKIDQTNVIVRGRAPLLSEVLVAGRLVFPDAGNVFELTLARPDSGQVKLFARDAAGETTRAVARCGT